MRQLRMSGSVGALGERSPGATRQATSVSDQQTPHLNPMRVAWESLSTGNTS